jgi:hypothetical protein
MPDTWSRREVEATVTDYFEMLDLELRGKPFVKADRIRRLAQLLDRRSEKAIEYKYGNVSAVLRDLGLPFVDGYKPYGNYQQLLFDVVNGRISQDRPLLALIREQVEAPAVVPAVHDILTALVKAPNKDEATAVPPRKGLGRVGTYRPVDYIEREARNQSLGAAGEEFVLGFERARLTAADRGDLAERVERVSLTQGDWLGFDIRSCEADGSDRFIEVKTTRYSMRTPFYVTRNEVHTSVVHERRYHLFRVFRFEQEPRVFSVTGRLDRVCQLEAISFEARVE